MLIPCSFMGSKVVMDGDKIVDSKTRHKQRTANIALPKLGLDVGTTIS